VKVSGRRIRTTVSGESTGCSRGYKEHDTSELKQGETQRHRDK